MSLKLLSGEDDSALEAGHHRLFNTGVHVTLTGVHVDTVMN